MTRKNESTFTIAKKGGVKFYKIPFGNDREITTIHCFDNAEWVRVPDNEHNQILSALEKKAVKRSKPKPKPRKEAILIKPAAARLPCNYRRF